MIDISDLKNSMLGEGLTDDDLTILAYIAEEKKYFKGEIIFSEKDKGTDLYVLTEGRICIERRAVGQRAIMPKQIQTVKQGELFGEMAFIEGKTRSATARAKSNVNVVIISSSELEKLVHQNCEFGFRFMKTLAVIISRRLRRMNEHWISAVAQHLNILEYDYH